MSLELLEQTQEGQFIPQEGGLSLKELRTHLENCLNLEMNGTQAPTKPKPKTQP
jgi:hypothetical protein